LNGTLQLLAYADDMNPLGDNLEATQKNAEALIDASKEVGLEVSIEKTTYILQFRHHSEDQNLHLKIASRSFEYVSQSKYLGTTVADQYSIREEFKSRWNFGNAYYH
jgi:hypothetical protein